MLKTPKSWALLVISGPELNPDEITRRLNVSPDYFHTKSTPAIKPGIENTGHWQINSKLEGELPLETHLWSLLKRLALARLELKRISKEYKVSLYTTVEFADESTEGISLGSRLLLLIGGLGIDLEINTWKNEKLTEEKF
ncbi:MAG: DUF4279 domain-containing protein [Leptospira sp.]|nr:DUF4279 domain-containing protein [Leptospira sp.]